MAIITTNNLKIENCELHNILRRPMQICRVAGLFPVEGLDDKKCTSLRFNIKSLYALYYFATIVSQIVISCFVFYFFFTNDIGLETIKCLIFYLSGSIGVIIMAKIAKKWPQLMKKASYLEMRVTGVHNKTKKYHLIVYGVLLFGLCEHFLSTLFLEKTVEICDHKNNIDLDFMRLYFGRLFVSKITTYAAWKMIYFEILSFQSTFMWNFTDAIVMCVSLYLTSYFNSLNKLIEDQQKQNSVNWKEIRLYHSYCVGLVNAVDGTMCYLILLSFFTNLFFICVQLFYLTNYDYPELPDCSEDDIKSYGSAHQIPMHAMNACLTKIMGILSPWKPAVLLCIRNSDKDEISRIAYNKINCHNLPGARFLSITYFKGDTLYTSFTHFLYYAYSFIFLFTRTSLAFLLAANINTVAGRPLLVLQNVSPSEYTIEVQRFIRQIRYTTTALSGVCFYITRGMILTVIATVIKYELVILQFCSIN